MPLFRPGSGCASVGLQIPTQTGRLAGVAARPQSAVLEEPFDAASPLCFFPGAGSLHLLPLIPDRQQPAYLDTHLSPRERAHDLVGRMTLEEKANQLEDWATSIPRLGIPDYQTWNESLHGVARAGYATVFPQAIGMAATWDPSMVQSMGDVISDEARAKYNQAQREDNHRIFYGLTFWSPNINIFRDPRWGRGQETYGEDPFLTGRLGIAFMTGVQGNDPEHLRAVATSKHFAVHSGPEQLRHGFNVDPSARDLEETYLPAFRATVTEGHVQSVMCAYNSIDEWPACTNKMLLKDHLRDAWGFKGFVVSDCGAIVDVNQGHKKTPDITHSAALSLQAGTDLSCSIWTPGFNTLADAVHQGLVSEDLVTQAAERLYTARFQLGLFDPPGSSARPDPFPIGRIQSAPPDLAQGRRRKHRAAEEQRRAAAEERSGHIAVIGPTADQLTSILGNYVGTPLHPVTPLEGIEQRVPQLADSLRAGFDPGGRRRGAGSAHRVRSEQGAQDRVLRHARLDRPPGGHRNRTGRADGLGKCQAGAPDRYFRLLGALDRHLSVPAPGHYVFTLEPGDSFPYSPAESYRFILDGKVFSEGTFARAWTCRRWATSRLRPAPRPPLRPS